MADDLLIMTTALRGTRLGYDPVDADTATWPLMCLPEPGLQRRGPGYLIR
jgi:hypothetical protein